MSSRYKQRIEYYNMFTEYGLNERAEELGIGKTMLERSKLIDLIVAVESGEFDPETTKAKRPMKAHDFRGREIPPKRRYTEEYQIALSQEMYTDLCVARGKRLEKYGFIFKQIGEMQKTLKDIYDFILYDGKNV